MFIKYSLLAAM